MKTIAIIILSITLIITNTMYMRSLNETAKTRDLFKYLYDHARENLHCDAYIEEVTKTLESCTIRLMECRGRWLKKEENV